MTLESFFAEGKILNDEKAEEAANKKQSPT